MDVAIFHLFEQPQLRDAVAALIHNEFWTDVPGASVEKMAARLGQASTPDALPLCLIGLQGDELLGAINLVDNDDDDHTDWHPWLAGVVVAESHRGQGLGSQLVQALLVEAKRLNFDRVYFGTDGPRFYERLGAVVHHVPREGFWFMRFDLADTVTFRSGSGIEALVALHGPSIPQGERGGGVLSGCARLLPHAALRYLRANGGGG